MAVCILGGLLGLTSRTEAAGGADEYLSALNAAQGGDPNALNRFFGQTEIVVVRNSYGHEIGMLSPVRPPVAKRPPAPPAPKPPAESARRAAVPPKDYPKGEVIGDQTKRLYLAGRPVGEIRAKKIRLGGELVNVDQVKLDIHIWPGNYLSKIAIPVDRGQYQVAYATGKGWVISPEKKSRIPAGYKPVQIGD
jgi:hypothetical protein